MSTTFDGGSAFPNEGKHANGYAEGGLSIRDYFAAKAMQAAITTAAAPYMSPDPSCALLVSKMAYQMADAMLAERSK